MKKMKKIMIKLAPIFVLFGFHSSIGIHQASAEVTDSDDNLKLSVDSQPAITEAEVSPESIKGERDKLLKDLESLNLKDKSFEFLQKIQNSWSSSELKEVYNKAKTASEKNDETDKQEEERKKKEAEEKAAEEERVRKEKEEQSKKRNSSTSAVYSDPSNSGTSSAASAPGGKVFGPNQAREAFEQITADLGVTGSEKEIWADVITRESGWNTFATNPSSGAYGLPQSLPGNKMATAGGDYLTNPYTQLTWMYNYVKSRYGSFSGINWYSRGWY